MSEEAGFEVARAFVSVQPDASDFAAALDEQIGGLSVSVVIVPDASDFAAAVDEQTGGLSASVDVGADTASAEASVEDLLSDISSGRGDIAVGADTSGAMDAAGALADEMSGMGATLDVGADTGTAAEGVAGISDQLEGMSGAAASADSALEGVEERVAALQAEADRAADSLGHVLTEIHGLPAEGLLGSGLTGLGAIPVTVVPNLADFADALDEEAGGLTVTAKVIPDASDVAASIEEQVGGDGIVIPVSADTGTAAEALQGLEAAEEGAASGASSVTEQYAALSGTFEGLSSQLDALEGRFGAIVGGFGNVSAEAVAAEQQLEGVERAFLAVGEEVESLGGQISAAGGDFSGLEGDIGAVSGMLSDLQGNFAAAEGAVDAFGKANFDALQGVQAGGDALEGVAGAAGDVEKAAPAAGEAASGLGGVLGELAGRMSYMAVDPFMWMYGLPMVIGPVISLLDQMGSSTDNLITQMSKADQASGFNVAGYQELSTQLSGASGKEVAFGMAAQQGYAMARGGAEVYAQAAAQVASVQQNAQSAADNLGQHLSELEGKYGITQQQAIQLADAAKVSASQLDGSGARARDAMDKVEAYGNANVGAAGQVAQLSTDVETFGDDALTASTRVSALDTAYNTLTGNLVSSQTQMLQVAQDFLGIEANATLAGASMSGINQQSLTLQSSFYSVIPAIEQTANAMTQQGDSSAQVTSYIQAQIDKLSGLTGGNQQAQQAVQGLQQWEDKLQGSMDSASQATVQAAQHMQDDFIKQLEDAGDKSKTTKTAVDELTTSVIATGDKSTETQGARAQLIKDLENAGISAQNATKLVDAFIKKIGQIPSHVNLSLTETASGTWSISGSAAAGTAEATGAGNARLTQHASGGLILGGSGRPRADDIHAMLSHGEYVVQAPAVNKYGAGMLDSINAMHFAEGGYAGDLAGLGAWTGAQYLNTASTLTEALEAAVTAAIRAAEESAAQKSKGSVNLVFNGTQMPTAEQTQALMMQLSAAVGVS